MGCGAPAGEHIDVWGDPERLTAEQDRIGRLRPEPWHVEGPLTVAGCFVAFAPGEAGPGRAGDRAWVGAAAVPEGGTPVGIMVATGTAQGPYVPGLLALREGRLLYDGLQALLATGVRVDVVMVDATGRDHPRRCGLAVQLGWALAVPTVGVTHRLLTDRDQRPPEGLHRRGDVATITLAGEAVGAWLCTSNGARPLAVHTGWRTGVATAVEVVLRTSTEARTPEPLRVARRAAREARASQLTSTGADTGGGFGDRLPAC